MKCKCGCRKETNGGNYCRGHNPNSGFRRGHPSYANLETLKKLKRKSKENWKNKEIRKKRIKGLKKSQTIEKKNKMKIIMTEWWKQNKNTPQIIKRNQKIRKVRKGKTYEEIYGEEKANNIVRKISKSCENREFTDICRKKLREMAIKRIEKQKFDGLPLIPCIGKNEKQILDNLEKEIGYKIIRQYKVCGYFLDGYCKELNLATEVDESYHKKQKEKDIERENIVKKELNCEFIRI